MTEWKQTAISGMSTSFIAFSPRNSRLARCSQQNTILHNVADGKRQEVLEHDDFVVGCYFSDENTIHCVTRSGELVEWTLIDGSANWNKTDTRRITAFPVWHLYYLSPQKLCVLVIGGGEKIKTDNVCTLAGDRTLESLAQIPGGLKYEQIAVTDKYIVYINHGSLQLVFTDQEEHHSLPVAYTIETENSYIVTKGLCQFVRVSALNDTVAATTANGRVHFWISISRKGLSDKSATSWHWHKEFFPVKLYFTNDLNMMDGVVNLHMSFLAYARELKSLKKELLLNLSTKELRIVQVAPHIALTPFGGLLSAGAETVLCKTPIGAGAKTSRLPRLVAPVDALVLSGDSSLVALKMEDNGVHVVQIASMSILSSIDTILHCHRSPNTVFVQDPRQQFCVVQNGKPGVLQWFSPSDMTTIFQVNVTVENAADGDMSLVGIPTVFNEVDLVQISKSSMATLESLVNFEHDHKRLRFWLRKKDQQFLLCDNISVSRETIVLAGCMNPVTDTDKIYITGTRDGEITVWEATEKGRYYKDISRTRRFPDFLLMATDIQRGGSWASVHSNSGSHVVVVWDTTNMEIVDVLNADGNVSSIAWTKEGRYLLVATDESVTCWCGHSLTRLWTVMDAGDVAASENGVFVWQKQQILEVDVVTGRLMDSIRLSSPVLNLLPIRTKGIRSLLAKTSTGLVFLHPANAEIKEKETTTPHHAPFANIPTQKQSESASRCSTVTSLRVREVGAARRMLDAPCHALPPVAHIAPLFINSCLAPPPQTLVN